MSWAVGYDTRWRRDIGYGVPAFCDHPKCSAEIDRGLAHVCGGEPYGGERGCGLYFCAEHLVGTLCTRCLDVQPAYDAKPDPSDVARTQADRRELAGVARRQPRGSRQPARWSRRVRTGPGRRHTSADECPRASACGLVRRGGSARGAAGGGRARNDNGIGGDRT
jgi:hypothetical protein